jgi:glucose-1-phosphate cytidylyltransferase
MKTIILCGGRGTRLGEHSAVTPKALIEIGGRPVLWHLLTLYSRQGFNDFILCLGHLGADIEHYFTANREDWRITFAHTGLDANTGARIKSVAGYLAGEDNFFVTYGDGLADIDLNALRAFHLAHGRAATLTAVHPQLNFGLLELDDHAVTAFHEKPSMKEWINGGFFVFQRRILDYLDDTSVLEKEPLERLAGERQLHAFRHLGFWKCMDTYKDNLEFNQLWDAGQAAWANPPGCVSRASTL